MGSVIISMFAKDLDAGENGSVKFLIKGDRLQLYFECTYSLIANELSVILQCVELLLLHTFR